MLEKTRWLTKATLAAALGKKSNRKTSVVEDEYSAGWNHYAAYLDQCSDLSQWLWVKGLEDTPRFCNVAGELRYQPLNSQLFNRQKILETLRREFPDAKSVTEYGCGVGRNLLFLKQHMPEVSFYGYELCQPGVDLARAAATKFHLDVGYSRLDYVHGAECDYVFPVSDVAFTMYSLEQLPVTNGVAVSNILRHVNLGSIHIEPVPENYPYTYRGLVGRLDHWKADYLRNFERNISTIDLAARKHERFGTAHNPLMFPSLYVLKKSQ